MHAGTRRRFARWLDEMGNLVSTACGVLFENSIPDDRLQMTVRAGEFSFAPTVQSCHLQSVICTLTHFGAATIATELA